MRVVSVLILAAVLPLARSQTSGLVYSRVLPVLSGGTTNSAAIDAIAVDAAGNTYLAGATENPAFPVTPGAPPSTYGGGTCIGGVYNPLLPPPTYPSTMHSSRNSTPWATSYSRHTWVAPAWTALPA